MVANPAQQTSMKRVANITNMARVTLYGGLYRATLVALACGLCAPIFASPLAHAAFKGCIANITPDTASVGAATAFTVNITNGIGSNIQWVRATVPSDNYAYQSNIVTGSWSVSDIGDGVLLAGGDAIGTGQTWSFQVIANTGIQNAGPESWSVQVAPDPDGNDIRTCTGSLNTSITGQLPQDQLNGVSNVVVSDITTDAATVSWDTDNPSTGMVYYGLSAAYGQNTALDGQYSLRHSARIFGLSAATTYHYQVVGTDNVGGYAYSIDNTFVTAHAPIATPPGQVGGVPSPATPTIDPAPQVSAAVVQADKEAPTIAIATVLSGSYTKPPMVTGAALDNVAVRTVEYSTDDGKNWLPVDLLSRNDRQVTFSFTPLVAADGNYRLLARAIDLAGQTAVSTTQTLVIDQLPPLVGGSMLMIGPEIVRPAQDGIVSTVMGQELRLITSAVGGATAITAEGVSVDQHKVTQSFSLTESTDKTVWAGAMDFMHPGTYRLTVKSVDGAGNHNEKLVGIVRVAATALVTDAVSSKPVKATVTVRYRDPETDKWTLWDASQYDQSNPAGVAADGAYSLYLPSGTYYLTYKAPGYSDANTESFTIDEPTVVSTDIGMHRRPGLHIGKIGFSIPWVETSLVQPAFAQTGSQNGAGFAQHAMVGKQLPADAALALLDGSVLKQTQLLGKPTILSVVSTWAPAAQDQLAILNQLDAKLLHVYAIDSGESASKVGAYLRIAGYDVPVITDSQNRLSAALDVSGLPTTYFLDRRGIVQHVITGVLSKDELLQYAVD